MFLTYDGILKLGDLGVSKKLKKKLAKEARKVGTPLFQAPEIVQHQSYSHKIDIWAIGIVLYYLAALHPPFSGDSLTLTHKIIKAKPKPLPAPYSANLFQFIMSFLHKLPNKRPKLRVIINSFPYDFEKKGIKENFRFGQSKYGEFTAKKMKAYKV